MNINEMNRIFEETAYIRTGGSKEELACANYLKDKCAQMGLKSNRLE